MRERRITCLCLVAIWAIYTSVPSACLSDSKRVKDQPDIAVNTKPIGVFEVEAKTGVDTADHDGALVAPHRMLQQQSAEDTVEVQARAQALQGSTSADDADAAAQTHANGRAVSAAARAAAPDAAQQSSQAAADPAAAEAAGPRLTRSEAHQLLNRKSTGTPQLMRHLPPEGRAAMERHRTCGQPFSEQQLQEFARQSQLQHSGPCHLSDHSRARDSPAGTLTTDASMSAGAFWMRPVTSVALVGNGPLTERQRQQIAAADLVIRLNKMNNRRALRTRTKPAGCSARHTLSCRPPDAPAHALRTSRQRRHATQRVASLQACGSRLQILRRAAGRVAAAALLRGGDAPRLARRRGAGALQHRRGAGPWPHPVALWWCAARRVQSSGRRC